MSCMPENLALKADRVKFLLKHVEFRAKLSKPEDSRFFPSIVCGDMDVVCVLIALPCGTCSKARGIPPPDARPGPGPQPSRD